MAQLQTAYRNTDIQTAPQSRLIIMLYDGAIRSAQEAVRLMDSRKYDEVNNHLIRAQEIVNELRASLNMKAGEVAVNLDRIYEYVQHQLMMGNVRKDKTCVESCIRIMKDLRDTWKELFDRMPQEEIPREHLVANPRDGGGLNLRG